MRIITWYDMPPGAAFSALWFTEWRWDWFWVAVLGYLAIVYLWALQGTVVR